MPRVLIPFLITVLVSTFVFFSAYHPFLVLLWLGSVFLIFAPEARRHQIPRLPLVTVLPALVRVLYYSPSRLHGDDLLTAYISSTTNFFHSNFFSGFPIDKTQFIAQFPSVYFALQKMILFFTSSTFVGIKLSVLPYVFITSLFLFLVAREYFGRRTAVISLILYAFFSPALYLETLGLHFISSTAVFLVFFYFLLRALKTSALSDYVLAGASAAACFLFYLTSYIAPPLFLVAWLLYSRRFRLLLAAILGFLTVIGPFAVSALTHDNYFLSRINQVSLITGSWSTPRPDIRADFIMSFQSLFKDGLSGHGGYNFGHLRFFNPVSLALIILGGLFFLLRSRSSPPRFLVLLVIVLSFLQMALSIPPPAFHRFSLSFPFLALVMAVPLRKSLLISALVLAVFIRSNLTQFSASIAPEQESPSYSLVRLITREYPRRHVHIAAFPGFVLDKFFYFSFPKNYLSLDTGYHTDYLSSFNSREPYLYVFIFPEAFSDKFRQADPGSKIINFSPEYSLFVN